MYTLRNVGVFVDKAIMNINSLILKKYGVFKLNLGVHVEEEHH